MMLPTTPLGRADNVPIAVVTGQARGFYFFQSRMLGDALTEAAIRDARAKVRGNDGLINVAVDSRQFCFPSCGWPLLSYQKTVVTGTLVRFHLLKEDDAAPPKGPPALVQGQAPATSEQAARLEDLFGRDPGQARELMDSMSPERRGALADFILAQDGILSSYDASFKAPAGASDARKAFLRWFLPSFTSYRLVFE